MYRLLDCELVRAAVTDRETELVLVTSDYLYEEIVRQGPGLVDPAAFAPITVQIKETTDPAWMSLPGAKPMLPVPPTPLTHPIDLTLQEIEIAVLVGSGWSAGDISRHLNDRTHTTSARICPVLAGLCGIEPTPPSLPGEGTLP